ncbi:DUF2254 domain-containing protein [Radiobacillus sp. PE A8.2]|uniref:DUF2254 domain-containing protein n=1 Tax=Radiobacillus sp. PE A8.2 TaxID=3380349 RepID=UPI00388F7381
MNLTKIWISIRDSFWFVPAVYSVVALLLVILFNATDIWLVSRYSEQIPDILETDQDIAKALYAGLLTAILTMTTISFSIIMVVLTTYSTQFSPRTLQDFMRSRMTHHVLGVFCFGFIFALIYLLLIGEQDTFLGPIIMAIIAIICLAFFVYFIHHAARWLQVNNLIDIIHTDSSRVIENTYKQGTFDEYQTWMEGDVTRIKQQSSLEYRAKQTGYVQSVEWAPMVRWAKRNSCVVELHVQIGDFVMKDLPIASLYAEEKLEEETNSFATHIVIGTERTDLQDIEFLIQKLVEIAVKAISPSINDPHTAINSINRIGSNLLQLGKVHKDIRFITDEDDKLRIIKHPKRYEDFLYKSFYQIVHYANGDVSIYYSLIEVLYKLSLASDQEIQQKIWSFHYYIVDAIEWDTLLPKDKQHLETIYEKFKQYYGVDE